MLCIIQTYIYKPDYSNVNTTLSECGIVNYPELETGSPFGTHIVFLDLVRPNFKPLLEDIPLRIKSNTEYRIEKDLFMAYNSSICTCEFRKLKQN